MASTVVLPPPSSLMPRASPPRADSPTSTASDSTPTSSDAVGGRMIKVIVVSDMVCPWCYIGFKHLNSALARLEQSGTSLVQFEVEFRPFPLISNMFPSDDVAIEKAAFFEKKFGKEKAKQMQALLAQKGEEVGIKFKMEGGFIRRTYRAHRLLTLAYTRGGSPLQQILLQHLFSAYFEKEEDIGAPATLANYAVMTGLFKSIPDAEEWVKGTEGEEGVKRLFQISQGCGIDGVPFVVVDGRWAISGCQGSEEYYKVLHQISKGELSSDKDIKANIPAASQHVCSPKIRK